MVLVVIPCFNEEVYLEGLVKKLLAAKTSKSMLIVIVDGGSTDRTPQIAQQFVAKYDCVLLINNPKRIQSAATNLAAFTFGQDKTYLIRLDAHADYPEDYCEILIEEAERAKAASVVVAMRTVGTRGFQYAVAAAQNSLLGNGGASHRTGNIDGGWVDHGHHALMRMDAFRSVGGYDETFLHNEDAELDYRLRKAGFNIWLTRKTRLTYYPRSTVAGLFHQYLGFGRGRMRTLLKHGIRPKIRQLLPVAVAPAVVVAPAVALALLTPLVWIAVFPLALWAVLCLTYGVALSVKAKKPVIAAAGVAAMIMHFGWSLGFWQVMLRNLFDNFGARGDRQTLSPARFASSSEFLPPKL